jgi:large subunit ribosomal protein L4
MELKVYNIQGKETDKKVNLKDTIFGIEPNDHAIYLAVKQYRANNRQGTHKARERADISGSTKKIKRQKGTGTARAGSIKNPLFRGGGTVFGPRPKDYSFKLNKKLKKLARNSALSYKAKEKNLTVVEDFDLEAPKTRNYTDFLNSFELTDKKSLLVLSKPNKNVSLSSRNLQDAKVVLASKLNTYDILNANHIILAESSIPEIEKIC